MYDGPFFPGFHLLIGLALFVFWLVVLAGVLWALYFVIRTAVTRGILRADAVRTGVTPAHHPAPRPFYNPPAPGTPSGERPVPAPPSDAAPDSTRRNDGTAPTV